MKGLSRQGFKSRCFLVLGREGKLRKLNLIRERSWRLQGWTKVKGVGYSKGRAKGNLPNFNRVHDVYMGKQLEPDLIHQALPELPVHNFGFVCC